MPDPARIEVDGAVVRVEWDDGRTDEISAHTLRLACPCAGCREPGARERLAAFDPDSFTVRSARLVGGYAVGFAFGPDGHSTGIFPYALLREVGDPEE